jgi:hypothetical protein
MGHKDSERLRDVRVLVRVLESRLLTLFFTTTAFGAEDVTPIVVREAVVTVDLAVRGIC